MSETQTTEKPKLNTKNFNQKPRPEYGYMYIGHIPHGFYEDEMKSYFSQFGRVCRVRLAHSKITGNYKGYGFVQFENKEVAEIAAQTMNNYLMFNKLLKCHVIPKEKLHPETFKNAKKKFFKPLRCMFRKKFNQKKSAEQLKKIKVRQSEKLKQRQEKLKALGINLDLNQILNPKTEEKKAKKQEKQKPVEDKKSESKPEQKVEKKPEQKKVEPKKEEQKNVTKKVDKQPQQPQKNQAKKEEAKKVEPVKRKSDAPVQEKSVKQQKQVPIKEQAPKQAQTQKKKNKK
ncbi:unnamed protein product [Brachionus calyciflorus]|uniref:RRM domain-containing protein n=1 Tax=Brachionus calyciflorus TaxID=104777 RepID=A0A813QXI0_9BILA|nr:unnamed protein product [Brachionus calyciflorus]